MLVLFHLSSCTSDNHFYLYFLLILVLFSTLFKIPTYCHGSPIMKCVEYFLSFFSNSINSYLLDTSVTFNLIMDILQEIFYFAPNFTSNKDNDILTNWWFQNIRHYRHLVLDNITLKRKNEAYECVPCTCTISLVALKKFK